MAKLSEICKQTVSKPYAERVSIGKKALGKLTDCVEEVDDIDEEGAKWTVLVWLRDVIGADGFFDEYEYRFLCDVFELEMEREELLEGFNSMSDEVRASWMQTIKTLSFEERMEFVRLAVCVCSADGKISRKERKFLKKYF